jgi:tetratricopeptide (TPR) repeat protein
MDRLMDRLHRLLGRLTPRLLAMIAGGTLLLALVIGGAWLWLDAQSERAQAVHADALAQASTARGAQASPEVRTAAMAALEAALAQAPGAPLAAQSAYELGNFRFDLGQYPAARAAYEVARAQARSATIRTLAQAGIAATWESERNFANAIAAYADALADRTASPFYTEDLLIGLGRSQELAGKRDEAIKTYQRLLKDLPKLRRETEIRGRLASLGVRT